MKKRLLFILCSIFVAANFAAAQTKTVTNSDLESHRQKRLQAERDYRENYERLGFPSPEELAKQIEQDKKERSELAERLRSESLEREKAESENAYWRAQTEILRYNGGSGGAAAQNNQGASNGNGFYPPVYFGSQTFYGYPNYGYSNRHYYKNRYRNNRGFWRGGIFYGATGPGSAGVRINNGGVRINVTPAGNRFPGRIRSPR